MEEGIGSPSTALHLQAGPTSSWTPNTSLGLTPRKEAGRCRTDAEFKLQTDNNTPRLLLSKLAMGRTVWQDMKTTFQCSSSRRLPYSLFWAQGHKYAEHINCPHSALQTSPEQMQLPTVWCSLITGEKQRTQLLQSGHLKKHWESLTSEVPLPQLAIKEPECFVSLKMNLFFAVCMLDWEFSTPGLLTCPYWTITAETILEDYEKPAVPMTIPCLLSRLLTAHGQPPQGQEDIHRRSWQLMCSLRNGEVRAWLRTEKEKTEPTSPTSCSRAARLLQEAGG